MTFDNNGTLGIRVNGILTCSFNAPALVPNNRALPLFVGASQDLTGQLNGNIRQLVISNYVR